MYSRPILRSTIKDCPHLQKFYKALFRCKTLRKGIQKGGGGWAWGEGGKSSGAFLKKICRKFSFFNGLTQTPLPRNSQNLLGATFFSQFSLKYLLSFFQIFVDKSCKSIFYVLAVNCYRTYILKGSNYRFSSVLFRIYFKNSYFNTSISNYLSNF